MPRIYQLNNLSTALKCLRARGMELVNNNVTDLADGNPRIWLGLIWQIVLHFQAIIEDGHSDYFSGLYIEILTNLSRIFSKYVGNTLGFFSWNLLPKKIN